MKAADESAIHVARLTIHEVDVRNPPSFSDKLVEDWRWQKHFVEEQQKK